MRISIIALLFFASLLCSKFITSKEKNVGQGLRPLKVRTLTQGKNSEAIFDGKIETCWESDALLPQEWIKVLGVNILLRKRPVFSPSVPANSAAFDGNLDSSLTIPAGRTQLSIGQLPETQKVTFAYKVGTGKPLNLRVFEESGEEIYSEAIAASDSYKLRSFSLPNKHFRIEFEAEKDFQLFELALRPSRISEKIIPDFGRVIPIKFLKITDSRTYTEGVELIVKIQHPGGEMTEEPFTFLRPDLIEFEREHQARFLLLQYNLPNQDWLKVQVCEVEAFDKNGISGEKAPARASKMPLQDLLGVNGYWGFGHNQYSKFNPPGKGIAAFAPFVSHVRNYHDMTWDLKDPDAGIDFKAMSAGSGTPAKEWVNWDLEYKNWVRHVPHIQASLQFFRFNPEQWDKPEQSAFNYAYNYTRHFGPTYGNGTITTVEAGNEPWKYDAATYQKILRGMARGAKEGDPAVEFFPCALQAADSAMEKTEVFKNYIDARIPEDVFPYLDGINVHHYSFTSHNVYKQRPLPPEAPASVFWEVNDALKWRDKHLPGKKIYLSEWGWDSPGGGEDCTHIQCVSEEQAANYLIRGALIAHRLGLDRATWFFYGNEPGPSGLYTRSGLLSSAKAGFQRKKTYYAFKHLTEVLGDKYFLRVFRESENLWGYYYGDSEGKATHLILWRPVAEDKLRLFSIPESIEAKQAEKINFSEKSPTLEVEMLSGNKVRIGTEPVILTL